MEVHRSLPHLDAVLHLHVSQQFAVDAEETEPSLVVVDHAVPLGGGLDEAGPQAAVWALQGPQQVPIHGMDQTRTLWTNMRRVVRTRGGCYRVCLFAGRYKRVFWTRRSISPLQPLMTRPSSAHTLAHVTSQSWPVKMARGVVNSARKTQTELLCVLQKTCYRFWPLEGVKCINIQSTSQSCLIE